MARRIYVLAPQVKVSPEHVAAATDAGCSEIVSGASSAMVRTGVIENYPFVYTELDDSQRSVKEQCLDDLARFEALSNPSPSDIRRAIKALATIALSNSNR